MDNNDVVPENNNETLKSADNKIEEKKEEEPLSAEMLKEELEKEKNSYLRLRAEFDNYRKRCDQDKQELAAFAVGNFLLQILPILDSFERAQGSFEKHSEDVEEIKKGIALIHKQFEDVLKKMSVEKIACVGQKFDPNLHEAIMQQESDKEEGTVLEEAQAGYKMKDKIIRHAMVIVATPKKEKEETT